MQATDSTLDHVCARGICGACVCSNFVSHHLVKDWLLDKPVFYQNQTFFFLDPNNKSTNMARLVACVASLTEELNTMHDWLVTLVKEIFMLCIEMKAEHQHWVHFLNDLGELYMNTVVSDTNIHLHYILILAEHDIVDQCIKLKGPGTKRQAYHKSTRIIFRLIGEILVDKQRSIDLPAGHTFIVRSRMRQSTAYIALNSITDSSAVDKALKSSSPEDLHNLAASVICATPNRRYYALNPMHDFTAPQMESVYRQMDLSCVEKISTRRNLGFELMSTTSSPDKNSGTNTSIATYKPANVNQDGNNVELGDALSSCLSTQEVVGEEVLAQDDSFEVLPSKRKNKYVGRARCKKGKKQVVKLPEHQEEKGGYLESAEQEEVSFDMDEADIRKDLGAILRRNMIDPYTTDCIQSDWRISLEQRLAFPPSVKGIRFSSLCCFSNVHKHCLN